MGRSNSPRNVPACNLNLPYVQHRDLWIYSNKLHGGSAQLDRQKTAEVHRHFNHKSRVVCVMMLMVQNDVP